MPAIPTHLSIDLDYWCEADSPRARPPILPRTFFKRVFSLGLPIRVYMYHQEVVPQVNASGCERLINMDYHSDWGAGSPRYRNSCPNTDYCLDSNGDPMESEGDWVDWIEWRAQGEFVWLPPSTGLCVMKGYGRCDEMRWHGQQWPPQKAMDEWNEWGLVRHASSPWKHINWAGIRDISVVISPEYLEPTPLIRDNIFEQLGIKVPMAGEIIRRGWDNVAWDCETSPADHFEIRR